MSEPIDVIIPWVNPNDESWKKDFEFWKKHETGNKDACRYRDWGFLKYVFRSIEENIPWVRNVFLVLASESQIPDWLNTECPKLKIVYHKDYIPSGFLPTYNSNVIELFYHRIEDLSEQYILMNDDMFFCKPLKEDYFFKDGKPVATKKLKLYGNTFWESTLHNSRNIANNFTGGNSSYMYDTEHLPVSYLKSIQQFVMTKVNIDFMAKSKFRKKDNLTHFMFYDLQCKLGKVAFVNFNRGNYMAIGSSNSSYNLNCNMCCINECEKSKEQAIKTAIRNLQNKFNKKSSFEF